MQVLKSKPNLFQKIKQYFNNRKLVIKITKGLLVDPIKVAISLILENNKEGNKLTKT